MSTQRTELDDHPQVGTDVVLLPKDGGTAIVGVVRSWSQGPASLVFTGYVDVPRPGADKLTGKRVWARATTPSGATVVFETVARATTVSGELGLTGLTMLAHESRRTNPRASARRNIVIAAGAGAPLEAATEDLSRSGCRVAQLPEQPVAIGEILEIDLRLDDGNPAVHTSAMAVRAAGPGQLALRFLDLQPCDGERIERLVFSGLSAHPTPG